MKLMVSAIDGVLRNEIRWGARGGVNATPPRRSGSRRAHHR
jgi:hypothetical protein